MKKLRLAPLLSAWAFTLLAVNQSFSAEIAPSKPVGISGINEVVGLVDLAPHKMPGSLDDYSLRSRFVRLEPGGAIHNHPHAGRPGIVLVTKGSVNEYRGSLVRTLKTGESWLETSDTVHWFSNPSSNEMAEIWVVDLVPKKK
jgi:quercetin dioxygenase-like cupin family protein